MTYPPAPDSDIQLDSGSPGAPTAIVVGGAAAIAWSAVGLMAIADAANTMDVSVMAVHIVVAVASVLTLIAVMGYDRWRSARQADRRAAAAVRLLAGLLADLHPHASGESATDGGYRAALTDVLESLVARDQNISRLTSGRNGHQH
jgi:hypothetical protein